MVFTFDESNPAIREAVRDFEIQWLNDLRSAATVDTYKAVLKGGSLIPLDNVPATLFSLAQLLGYVTRMAKFFTEVPADTTKKFENKAVCVLPSCVTDL